MEDIKATILGYVTIIDSTIDDEDALVLFCLDSVINRFLSYTNRQQLVEDWEDTTIDVDDKTIPIPTELNTVLAEMVVETYRTKVKQNAGETQNVEKIVDGQQEITYSGKQVSNMSEADTSIFIGSERLFNKYRLGTIINDYADSTIFQNNDF